MTDVGYKSPFAAPVPEMPTVAGVTFAAGCSGMRYQGRDDVLLVALAEDTSVAGVYTRNTMCGEPIKWGRKVLGSGSARALVVNAGFANVFTGEAGYTTVENTAAKAAELVGCAAEEVQVSSTGIIGDPIDEEKLLTLLPKLSEELDENNWEAAAKAIMTTDTFPKAVSRQVQVGDTTVTVNGIIKGSGMIEPNMATMLGYVFTDAVVSSDVLQAWLDEDKEVSYHCMTVDSDTSTSDTVLCFATGQASHDPIANAESAPALREAFREVHIELAKLVAKDGEGITKFITVNVKGAESDLSARVIGKSIANSPMVKTAAAGEDANWGRIAMAVGKCGEPVDQDNVSIWIGDTLIAEYGQRHPEYDEAPVAEYMKGSEITITVDVGKGAGEATVWTMDLTHEYIKINAEYRT